LRGPAFALRASSGKKVRAAHCLVRGGPYKARVT
jgi:hypothetical protein